MPTDDERRARVRAWHKKKMEDPEYRERKRVAALKSVHRIHEDPEALKAYRAKIKEREAAARNDPVRNAARKARIRANMAAKMSDPEYADAHHRKSKEYVVRDGTALAHQLDTPETRALIAANGTTELATNAVRSYALARIAERMWAELGLPGSEYQHIPGTNDQYCISMAGQVMSCGNRPAWYPVATTVGTNGYPRVTLITRRNGANKRIGRTIHGLVLLLFGPPKPSPYHWVLHRNDNKQDYRLENLYWGTRRDNVQDAVRNGVWHRGEAARVKRVKKWMRSHGYRVTLDTGPLMDLYPADLPPDSYVSAGVSPAQCSPVSTLIFTASTPSGKKSHLPYRLRLRHPVRRPHCLEAPFKAPEPAPTKLGDLLNGI